MGRTGGSQNQVLVHPPQGTSLKTRAGSWRDLGFVSEALSVKEGELGFDPQNSQDRYGAHL